MKTSRRRFLTTVAMTTAATQGVIASDLGNLLRGRGLSVGADAATAAGDMPAFKVERWVNSPPLTADMLRGKVVLVDFWEWTCINWIRTAPYVKAWHRDYANRGLVVVGVHAPEFEFGKLTENIDRGIRDHGRAAGLADRFPVEHHGDRRFPGRSRVHDQVDLTRSEGKDDPARAVPQFDVIGASSANYPPASRCPVRDAPRRRRFRRLCRRTRAGQSWQTPSLRG
jgi:thiol-disulfide isomerase/thioredoxin